MKRTVIASAIITTLAVAAYGQKDAPAPGMEPFNPTKLDWLCLEAEAQNPHQSIGRDEFRIMIVPTAPDIARLLVIHHPKARRDEMADGVRLDRAIVEMIAKSHQFGWVKVREEYLEIEAPPK